jgi:hypothetical protein
MVHIYVEMLNLVDTSHLSQYWCRDIKIRNIHILHAHQHVDFTTLLKKMFSTDLCKRL